MNSTDAGPFDHLPRNAGGHFVINLYAAIYRLLDQTRKFSELSGGTLEDVFSRYPFLREYFNQMRRQMPAEITWEAATGWWQEQLDSWEAACTVHLPLQGLAHHAGIDFRSRLAFMLIGIVEEDSRFGTLIAELQEPLAHRRPTLDLVGEMMMDVALVGQSDPWTVCRPLIAAGVVEVQNHSAPRSEWLLRVPPLLWDAVRGQPSQSPAPWCSLHGPELFADIADLILPEPLRAQVAKLPGLIASGRVRVIVLRSTPGSDVLQVAGALARSLGRRVVEVDSGKLTGVESAPQVGPFAALTDALPCVSFDLGPGETVALPRLLGYRGPIVVLLGTEGGLSSDFAEAAVTLMLPEPEARLRERHWREAVGDRIEGLADIVDGFHLGGDFIRKVARIALAQVALDGRESLAPADVREASRTLNRQLLDNLANPIATSGSWGDLIAPPGTRDTLIELERRCRHRERLQDHLGPAFSVNGHRGVRALFTGSSGTGKTLAARILACELGMDLYRVDLAAVVNKYIGETEKNLHRVLSRAEALDVVLLLDEGDALLAQRTDVRTSNDRYANLETNYLLQRLEHYRGIVIVTTNLGDNIDQAFQRRMDVVVPFFAPQPEERLHILKLHLPVDHQVDEALLERAALRCALTGSQIRNAALYATLTALEERCPVHDRHLEEGLRSEYRKAGGLCPIDASVSLPASDRGVEAFLTAFARA